ncbi:S1/P1 Nuclease [Echinicola strongylocentroti]|uniref:S1/P1 Nuclease n=1 Tax=Echinicola strongylocentroti TaxID=1795355 RepID=A0A2Z4IFV6_9BACT|nr:zinc dependent phospholipase C family protein [Echinicola strongylocentroti]AWW29834.1 S1/P1 Nuclease [Echinicola strongylocentroti]
MKRILLFTFSLFTTLHCFGFWGFYAHKKINRLAVFSLPLEMIGFYKENIASITENAVNPDKRRYAVKGEAEKHYIDADIYGDSAIYTLPRYWDDAVEMFGEDSLRKYGIAPWNVHFVKTKLTQAFKDKNTTAILRLSADLGHYIGDINVPLHTTVNYNGQLTGQEGIHGFWESRIPELLAEDFDLFVGKAEYIPNTQIAAWEAVIRAHEALDSVLLFEEQLSREFSDDKKYSFEERGSINTKVYSRPFTIAYNSLLDGQVERQMKHSIKMIADFWYTAWVDAGQPELTPLLNQKIPADPWKKSPPENNVKARDHGF